jgi:hypothetical protein
MEIGAPEYRRRYPPPRIPFRAVKRVGTLSISVVARAHGEQPPEVTDAMDQLLAPLYMRAVQQAGERGLR